MATSPKKPVIPPVLRASKEINQFAEKTREAIGVLQGQRGNELDRAVTFRDALGDDFLKNLREGFRGIGGVPAEGDTNFDVPPIPTGFSARAGFEYAVLAWDEPTYSNHAYSEVFWHDSDDISAATRYGIAGGSMSVFLVDMEPDTTKYFWVRFVSTAGVAGQFNSTTGTPATTAIDVTYVLGELTGQIREDQLFSDLADRIDLIDGTAAVAGSVNARIAAETASRQAAITALQSDIDTEVSDRQSAITTVTNAVNAEVTARQNAVNSLQASIADLEGLSAFASSTAYAIDDLVKYSGAIYKCIQATTTPSPDPTNTSYWEKIGDYDSLGGAIAGVASDLSDVESRVTTAEGNITSTSTALSTLQATVNDANTGLSTKASSSDLTTAVSDIYGAEVSSFTNISAQFDSVATDLGTKATSAALTQAVSDIYGAQVSAFTNINAQFTSVNTAINTKASTTALNQAKADIYASSVSDFTNINAAFTTVNNSLATKATSTDLTNAVSNIYGATVNSFTNIAAKFTTVDAAIAGNTTAISSKAESQALTDAVANIYGAEVSAFTNIDAQFTAVDTALASKASVTQLNQAKTDIYGSAVSAFTNIDAQFTSVDTALNTKASTTQLNQAVTDIYGAQVSAFSNIDAQFTAVDTALSSKASISQLNQAKTDIYGSQVSAFTNISAAFDSVNTSLAGKATSTQLTDAVADIYGAAVTSFTNISAKFDTVDSAVAANASAVSTKAEAQALTDAVSNIYGAQVSAFTNIAAEFNAKQLDINSRATVAQLNQAKTDIYGSAVSSFSNIDAEFQAKQTDINSRATVSQLNTAVAGAESNAVATATTQVYSTLGGNQAYVQQQVSSWDGAGARWTTKTQVGDLIGGIGILNDGVSTRLYIQADKFAIYDSSLPTNRDDLVPFVVTGGKTYIKSAAIQDATIEVAKIKDGFLDNLTAAKGTLAQARITKGDIFNLTVGDQIASSNYSAGSTGWRIRKDGTVEFNGGTFRGAVRFLSAADAANARADLNVADGADNTASNIAAGFAGQGALATQSTVTWSSQVTGAGKPADYADVTSQNTAAAIAGQGALATANAADWSTQIAGAGKPADYADVTSQNTAAAIAGQGALATQSAADWGSQVSGTGKPTDYADVTSANTAYDTSRVAGISASSVRDQASAGAGASSTVNTWTRPSSTLIDGNKIFTGDAYVDTLQIKGNAVIVPAYDDLSVYSIAPNWPNWKTPANGLPELTITLDVDCRIILLWFTRTSSQSSGAGDYQIRLYRGGTQIEYIPSYNNAAVHSGTIQQNLTAGTYTFSMQIRAYNAYLYDASIIALGVQR